MLCIVLWAVMILWGCWALSYSIKQDKHWDVVWILFCSIIYFIIFLKELWRYCNGL